MFPQEGDPVQAQLQNVSDVVVGRRYGVQDVIRTVVSGPDEEVRDVIECRVGRSHGLDFLSVS